MKALKFLTMIALLSLLAQGAAPTASAAQPPPARPDLTVTNVWSAYAGYADTWYMYYTVRNIGPAASPAFGIVIQNAWSPAVVQSFNAAGLASGALRTYRRTWTRCEFEVKITVDSAGLIAESNGSNNSRTYYHLC